MISTILSAVLFVMSQSDVPTPVTDALPVQGAPSEDAGTVTVQDVGSGVVVLAGPRGGATTRLALPPSSYSVTWTGPGGTGTKVVTVGLGDEIGIAEAALQLRGELFVAPTPAPGVLGEERPETAARAELVLYQTIHGIFVGTELCGIGRCGDDGRAWVATPTITGATGLAASLYLTRRGITPGSTLAIDSGTAWGFWNATVVANTINEINSGREVSGTLLAGQMLGLGTGVAASHLVKPRAGDISLANTVGIWMGVLTLLGHAADGFTTSSDTVWLSLLAATDLGFAGGAILAPKVAMSRGRTLVIDAGGVLGLLTGMAFAVMVDWEPDDFRQQFFVSAMTGAALGLGGATYFTREWDAPELPASVMLVPTDGGAMAMVGLRL